MAGAVLGSVALVFAVNRGDAPVTPAAPDDMAPTTAFQTETTTPGSTPPITSPEPDPADWSALSGREENMPHLIAEIGDRRVVVTRDDDSFTQHVSGDDGSWERSTIPPDLAPSRSTFDYMPDGGVITVAGDGTEYRLITSREAGEWAASALPFDDVPPSDRVAVTLQVGATAWGRVGFAAIATKSPSLNLDALGIPHTPDGRRQVRISEQKATVTVDGVEYDLIAHGATREDLDYYTQARPASVLWSSPDGESVDVTTLGLNDSVTLSNSMALVGTDDHFVTYSSPYAQRDLGSGETVPKPGSLLVSTGIGFWDSVAPIDAVLSDLRPTPERDGVIGVLEYPEGHQLTRWVASTQWQAEPLLTLEPGQTFGDVETTADGIAVVVWPDPSNIESSQVLVSADGNEFTEWKPHDPGVSTRDLYPGRESFVALSMKGFDLVPWFEEFTIG